MSEILFHGKRLDNGEWVEGFYFERKDNNDEVIEAFIIQDAYEQIINGQRHLHSSISCECFRVDPITVGQYIGRTDKNGNRIFEGQIVKVNNKLYRVDYYDPWSEYILYSVTSKYYRGLRDSYNEFEIVGNIHDNPELMEV